MTERRWITAILLLSLSTFLAIAWQGFVSFAIPAIDFSIFDHLIPNTARGRFMVSAACGDCNHFGVHSTPILFLLYPFHRLFDHPLFLTLLHPLVLWSGAIPLYLLSRRLWVEGEAAAHRILLLLIYFSSPFLIKILDYQFHIEVFYVPLFLWLFYFLEVRRWIPMLLVAALIFSVKEDGALYLAAFAVGASLTRKLSWKLGTALVATSILVFVINMKWVIPANSGLESYRLASTSGRFGGSIGETAIGMLSNWNIVLMDLLRGAWLKKLYLFLFLPLLEPIFLIAIAPFALIHSIADSPLMRGLGVYYSAPYFPITIAAFTLVLARERLPLIRLKLTRSARTWILVIALLLSFPAWFSFRIPRSEAKYEDLRALRSAMSEKGSVCAQNSIFPHLGYRREMALLSDACLARRMDYYVIHPGVNLWPQTGEEVKRLIEKVSADPTYERREFGGFILFSKVGDQASK